MEQVFYTNQPLPLLAGLAGRWRFGDGETRLIAVVRAVDVGIKGVQLLDGGAFVDEADVVDGVAVLVGPALVPSAPSADPSLTIVGLDDSRAPATIPVDSNASLPSGCTPT